jgi:hypothetical protein
MNSHIRCIEFIDRRLSPAEAEVLINVYVDEITPTTSIRGRLMGPTCRYATTVEVAYSLRPVSYGQLPSAVVAHVIIPEPSLWDPASPFLYHGPIELWQDDLLLERVVARHGLRARNLGPTGLRWNGSSLPLNGWTGRITKKEEMLALRDAGHNLLTVTSTPATAPLWEMADRIGFLLVGTLQGLDEPLAVELAKHPSCFGFVLEPATWAEVDAQVLRRFKTATSSFVGIDLSESTTELPAGADFVLCDAQTGKAMSGAGVFVIVRCDNGPPGMSRRE